MPAVVRWLGVNRHSKAEHRREQEAELAARNEAIAASRKHLKKLIEERKLKPETVKFLSARHDHRAGLHSRRSRRRPRRIHDSNNVRLEMIAAERDFLYECCATARSPMKSRRRLERDLDLEEATILARRDATPL